MRHVLLLLLIFADLSRLVNSIKYTLTKTNGETIHYDEDFITSEKNVKKVTVQDEFHVFDDDLLQITVKIPIFVMDKNFNMHKMESGAFVDQEITETIVISNSNLDVIHKGTFKNLKIFELVLKGNEIERIEEEAIVNLPNLQLLNLSINKIKKMFDTSFIAAPAVSVDMAFNRLKEVCENCFSFMSMTRPTTLLLDHNEIESVDPSAFEGLQLRTLNLRSNQIEELPSEIFEGESHLTTVYLQDNKLETLPKAFFELGRLRLVTLSENPLECETQEKLRKLARRTSAKVRYEDTC